MLVAVDFAQRGWGKIPQMTKLKVQVPVHRFWDCTVYTVEEFGMEKVTLYIFNILNLMCNAVELETQYKVGHSAPELHYNLLICLPKYTFSFCLTGFARAHVTCILIQYCNCTARHMKCFVTCYTTPVPCIHLATSSSSSFAHPYRFLFPL